MVHERYYRSWWCKIWFLLPTKCSHNLLLTPYLASCNFWPSEKAGVDWERWTWAGWISMIFRYSGFWSPIKWMGWWSLVDKKPLTVSTSSPGNGTGLLHPLEWSAPNLVCSQTFLWCLSLQTSKKRIWGFIAVMGHFRQCVVSPGNNEEETIFHPSGRNSNSSTFLPPRPCLFAISVPMRHQCRRC